MNAISTGLQAHKHTLSMANLLGAVLWFHLHFAASNKGAHLQVTAMDHTTTGSLQPHMEADTLGTSEE